MKWVKMENKKIRIAILGAGSLGSLFGGYLANNKSETTKVEIIFFCRKAHAEVINKSGLTLKTPDEEILIANINAFKNENHWLKEGFDYVFLTVKANDVKTALIAYKDLLKASRWLILLQNGIGISETVKKYHPEKQIIRGVTTNGAFLDTPGHVIHTGFGYTKIGFPFIKSQDLAKQSFKEHNNALNKLKDLLTEAGLDTTISENINATCWEKVFVNIGINPFGALTRLKNGDLLENSIIKALMGVAVDEAMEVAKLKNINLPKKDYKALMYDVAIKTSENKNSMLQDVLKEKKTEIDYINGSIVRYAENFRLKVPINALLTGLVKGLEESFEN